MKVNVVVPLFPSLRETSLIVKLGIVTTGHGLSGDAVLRGAGATTTKSAALLSVSVQPFAIVKHQLVLLKVGAGPLPSKKLALP